MVDHFVVSPGWTKNKKATVGPANYDENFFQYAATVRLSLYRMGLFSVAHRWVSDQKGPPSLQSVSYILQ